MTTHNKPQDSEESNIPSRQPTPEHLIQQSQEPKPDPEIPPELKANLQRIDELKEKVRLTPKLSEGITILFATILTYLIAFAYKYSCLAHYDLPLELIKVDAEDLLITGVATFVILTLPLLVVAIDTFLASILSKTNLIKYHKYRLHIGIVVMAAFVLLLFTINLGWKLTTLLTLLQVPIIRILRRDYIKSRLESKPNTAGEKPGETSTLMRRSEDSIKRLEIFATYTPVYNLFTVATGLLLFLTAMALMTAGNHFQERKTKYAFLATNPPKLLITRNGTSAIFADYDTKLGIIKKRWTIIDINNLPHPLSITNFLRPPEIEKDDILTD